MIVGEAPGVEEEKQQRPFVGVSGQELSKMLHEAGILRTEVFITNVCHTRPLDNDIENYYVKNTKDNRIPGPELVEGISRLRQDIAAIRPDLIIALGDTALWALTGKRGIVKWRGSQIWSDEMHCKVLPTYHPAAILRQWSWRFIAVEDLKRAQRWLDETDWQPQYRFTIRPSFDTAISTLSMIEFQAERYGPITIACDIETQAGHIDCVGLAWSDRDAICIPFMCRGNTEGYWMLEEEVEIVLRFQRLFRHPNIRWIFQNGLYDLQYFARYWQTLPSVYMDTMLAHHVCFAGLPKGLDFLSSMYCHYHLYWKDEGKEREKHIDDDQMWTYNCKDCVTTYECATAIGTTISAFGLDEPFRQQMRTFRSILKMMIRGVACDLKYKAQLIHEVGASIEALESWINEAIGYPINLQSHPQMKALFYDDLRMGVVKHKKTHRPTTDKTAMEKFAKWQPLLKPLTTRIEAARSGGAIAATFIKMRLDQDQRIRCSYNVAGTETYRLSSSQNAFGSGGNLQNIPRPHDPDDEKDVMSWLPNVRRLFTPDPGCVIIDIDLKKADVFVVAWESNDDELKSILRTPGANLHLENAKAIFANERLTKNSREYTMAKSGVHATNYGVGERTLAITLGITVREAGDFIKRWLSAHPGIADWHRRVEDSLTRTRRVSNAFGYQRYYFDRVDGLLPEALAWIPQSTVGLVTNRALNQIDEELPHVQPLLQTHDSLTLQTPKRYFNPHHVHLIESMMTVLVPYDDPLIIPWDIKWSDKSWGDCEELQWDNVALFS